MSVTIPGFDTDCLELSRLPKTTRTVIYSQSLSTRSRRPYIFWGVSRADLTRSSYLRLFSWRWAISSYSDTVSLNGG